MPIRIANQTIVLQRDGKRIVVKPKEKYDFTAKELEEIKGINKNAVRQPINETVDASDINGGGITNLDQTDANPNASTPAPLGAATSPEAGAPAAKVQQKAATKTDKAQSKDEEL